MFELNKPPLQKIKNEATNLMGVELYILRDDLNHPHIQGNKARKLKYNFHEAKKLGKNKLLTFGGAWSNHIYSTAFAAKLFGFRSVGVIRGEKPGRLSDTLEFALSQNMELYFVSREEYKVLTSGKNHDSIKDKFGDFYMIPEGGSNALGVKGCAEIVDDIPVDFTHLCCAAGTSATAAGILSSLSYDKKLMIFPALKNGEFLEEEMMKFLPDPQKSNYEFIFDYHFGGYAKLNQRLLDFITMMNVIHQLPLDQVYTAKMMFGLFEMIRNGAFGRGDVIVVYHSGGLQGLKGLDFGYNIL